MTIVKTPEVEKGSQTLIRESTAVNSKRSISRQLHSLAPAFQRTSNPSNEETQHLEQCHAPLTAEALRQHDLAHTSTYQGKEHISLGAAAMLAEDEVLQIMLRYRSDGTFSFYKELSACSLNFQLRKGRGKQVQETHHHHNEGYFTAPALDLLGIGAKFVSQHEETKDKE